MMSGQCWPEQEAVRAWLEKYQVQVGSSLLPAPVGAVRELIEAVTAPRLQSNRALERLLGEFEILKKNYNEVGQKIQELGRGIECQPKDGLTVGQRQAYEALGRPVPGAS